MATQKTSKRSDAATRPDPMQTKPLRINRIIKELGDTFSLVLQPHEGHADFSFQPGQFNMLYVYGVGEVPISISGDPARREILVHTTREVGTVTRAMRKLRVGDSLGVRGPYGKAWPVDEVENQDVVLITGGIGLAPLRPMIHYLLTRREKYGRIVLLYGARTPEDILYRKDLEKWRSRFDLEMHLTVDHATGAWRGNVGVVTSLVRRSPFDPQNCIAMVCGPEIMMRFAVMELQKRGVADDHIYISMERNMKCGIGLCGHCQLGPTFVCKDGPVYCYADIRENFTKREM